MGQPFTVGMSEKFTELADRIRQGMNCSDDLIDWCEELATACEKLSLQVEILHVAYKGIQRERTANGNALRGSLQTLGDALDNRAILVALAKMVARELEPKDQK